MYQITILNFFALGLKVEASDLAQFFEKTTKMFLRLNYLYHVSGSTYFNLFNVQVATKDEIKGNSFRKKEIHSMSTTEINLKSKVRLNTGGCQFYKDINDHVIHKIILSFRIISINVCFLA